MTIVGFISLLTPKSPTTYIAVKPFIGQENPETRYILSNLKETPRLPPESLEIPLSTETVTEEKLARYWIHHYSAIYGANEQEMIETVKGESSFNFSAVGDNGASRGISQFQELTFYGHAKEMGFENADWENPEDQIKLMAWMFSQGKEYHWTVWKQKYGSRRTVDL